MQHATKSTCGRECDVCFRKRTQNHDNSFNSMDITTVISVAGGCCNNSTASKAMPKTYGWEGKAEKKICHLTKYPKSNLIIDQSNWNWKYIYFCVYIHKYVMWMISYRTAVTFKHQKWKNREERKKIPFRKALFYQTACKNSSREFFIRFFSFFHII